MEQIKLFTEGKVQVKERKFTRLLGGFSETSPIVTTKQIAELLGKEIKHVNERINANIEHFEDVHILDLKVVDQTDYNLEALKTLGYTNMQISKANNIYILSESGFLLYLKFAEGEKAVEIYKEFLEDYFKIKAENKILKATLKEQISQLRDTYYVTFGKGIATGDTELLMKSQQINNQIIELEKQLTEELTIEKYKVYEDKYNQFMDNDGCFTFENASKILSTTANNNGLKVKLNKISLPKMLREKCIISKDKSGDSYRNLPNSGYEEYFNVTTRNYTTPAGENKSKTQSTITTKGLDFIYGILKEAN